MVVDYGNLIDLVDRGLTQPVESAALDAAVPANLRDPDGHWFALSMRARVIYVSKDRVQRADALTYEELADPKWKGRVCIRSGQHPYNTSLFAAMIAKDGAGEDGGVPDRASRPISRAPPAAATATWRATSSPTSATSASPIPTMSA